MLKIKTVEGIKIKESDIELGAYFINSRESDADMLIVKNSNSKLALLNVHSYMVINEDDIFGFLNRNNYYEVDVILTRE